MAGDVIQKDSGGGKHKGLRRPKRRLGIRIDMTPMVDIAFLLLIFYMVTTVFAMPQAMEINLPPKAEEETVEDRVKVKESNLLRIYVDKYDDYYYKIGSERVTGQDIKVPWPIPGDSIRELMIRYNWDRPKLNTLLLSHPEAKYSKMVDLLDEVEVVEAILRGNDEFMTSYKAANPEEERFSFRYSIDHWSDRDTKTFDEKVYSQTGGVN
ncbi:MAG: biopolymer transporter ExbD [Candidatus Zixiibacteriota bacterium]